MRDHALVIGAGVAGLLAARVLAARFGRVTLLERHAHRPDDPGAAPPARGGVPQSRCLHLLAAEGLPAFDALAPGWREALLARGGTAFDATADAALRSAGGWQPRTCSGTTLYASSRGLLEAVLRDGATALPNVVLRTGVAVRGLHVDGDRRVRGLHLADAHTGRAETVAADGVVDASGAASALPQWLAALPGGAAPTETWVPGSHQYVSRWFRLPPGAAPDWHCLSVAPDPAAGHRSAMMLRAEHGRWNVVLLAAESEPMPADDAAFLAYTAPLAGGALHAVLARAEPISPIHRYGATFSRWRHAERLAGWPAGLVALGDAVCALDPYFGLGMTAAAQGVRGLAAWLDEGQATDTAAAQQRLAALHLPFWQRVTGCDADGEPLAPARAPRTPLETTA